MPVQYIWVVLGILSHGVEQALVFYSLLKY